MRLSEWRKAAPTRDSMSNRVMAVLNPLLHDLGADPDPECWVIWGDDPEFRYAILAATPAGLISVAFRLSGPEDGPRATAKLVRWSKLTVSELAVEASGGHRIVAVQVEGQVLKGVDQEADRICEFVRGLIAGIDGRAPQTIPVAIARSGAARVGTVKRMPASGTAAAARPSKPKGPAPAKPKAPQKGLAVATPEAPRRATAPERLHAVPAGRAGAAASAAHRTADSTPSQPEPRRAIPATTAPPAALPGPAASPARHKPIAARAAAGRPRQHPDERAAVDALGTPDAPDAPGAAEAPTEGPSSRAPVEREADRSEWIGPHPIGDAPSRDPNRPRPWTP